MYLRGRNWSLTETLLANVEFIVVLVDFMFPGSVSDARMKKLSAHTINAWRIKGQIFVMNAKKFHVGNIMVQRQHTQKLLGLEKTRNKQNPTRTISSVKQVNK